MYIIMPCTEILLNYLNNLFGLSDVLQNYDSIVIVLLKLSRRLEKPLYPALLQTPDIQPIGHPSRHHIPSTPTPPHPSKTVRSKDLRDRKESKHVVVEKN